MLEHFRSRLSHRWGEPSHSDKQDKNHQLRACINWVIPARIAIGFLPKEIHIDILQELQIRSILSLCSEGEGTPPESLLSVCHWERFPLPDSHWTDHLTLEMLTGAIEKLHRLQSATPPVYIHCLAGVERSPTVCIAYLCYFNKLKVWEGLRYLKQVHRSTNPTVEQLKVIQALVESKT